MPDTDPLLSTKQSPAPSLRKDLWTLIKEEKERERKYANLSEDKTKEIETQGRETTLLFLGGKNSGKTSIVLRFLDRDETPTPTIGLEYTFGRRSRAVNSAKDVSHIWELAGGNFLIDLATIPITEMNVHLSTIVIVLDLSKPGEITPLIESFLSKLSQHVNTLFAALEKRGSKRPAALRTQSLRRYGADHPDLCDSRPNASSTFLDPFPLPLLIIGTNYDRFRNMESEHRKIVTKYLRILSHTHGASLIYTSTQDETTVTRVRGILNHHAFRSNAPKGNLLHIDHNKPVFVFVGADSYAQIGPAPSGSSSSSTFSTDTRNPLISWKEDVKRLFPISEKTSSSLFQDSDASFVLEKFPEPVVDAHRAQKDQELEKYRKASARRAKETAGTTACFQEETRNGGKFYNRNKTGIGLRV